MKEKECLLAGSVILYNPDDHVLEYVASYIDNLDKLFVIDNQGGADVASRIAAQAPQKVAVIKNSENEGIAKPLNRVLRLCEEEGFDLLLTMDQDSRFLPNGMGVYRSEAENFDWETTFSLGPATIVQECKSFKLGNAADRLIQWNPVRRMITSGSILSVQNARRIGGFDEGLFIDEVDNDICYRASRFGFKLFQSPDILLLHQIGKPVEKRFLSRTIRSKGHPPERKYYIARNRIVVWRRFHRMNELYFFRHYIFENALDFLKIFYVEDDKLKKAKYFLRGVRDGFWGRVGKRL